MREKIFRLFADANLPLLKLYSEENNLESIFLQLTEDSAEDTGDADAAATDNALPSDAEGASNDGENSDGDDENPYTPLFKS